MRARDKAGRVLALPNQTPHLIEDYGLTRAEVDRDVWLIDAAGRNLAGAAAVNRVWREVGGVWRAIAALYTIAPIGRLEDRVYRWAADHRDWLSRGWGAEPEWHDPPPQRRE